MTGRNRLRAVENAFEVDRDDQVEIRFGHLPDQLTFLDFDQLPIAQDAGVADHHVDAAVFGNDIIHPFLDIFAAGNVDFVEGGIWPEFLSSFLPDFFVDITDDDFGALFGKTQGGGFANPCRAAGDKHNFIFHAHKTFSFRCKITMRVWLKSPAR